MFQTADLSLQTDLTPGCFRRGFVVTCSISGHSVTHKGIVSFNWNFEIKRSKLSQLIS